MNYLIIIRILAFILLVILLFWLNKKALKQSNKTNRKALWIYTLLLLLFYVFFSIFFSITDLIIKGLDVYLSFGYFRNAILISLITGLLGGFLITLLLLRKVEHPAYRGVLWGLFVYFWGGLIPGSEVLISLLIYVFRIDPFSISLFSALFFFYFVVPIMFASVGALLGLLINKYQNTKVIHVKNKRLIMEFILLGIIFQLMFVSGADWYKGELHTYTGFRGSGYGNTDSCFIGIADDFTVSDLKTRAKARGITWQGYADENFCLDSSEFTTVKNDCTSASDLSFTCLSGETLTVKDDTESAISETYCVYCTEALNNPLCKGVIGQNVEPTGAARAARIGAYGISTYINPDGSLTSWCRTSLSPQTGINSVKNDGGISVIHSPFGEVTLGLGTDIWDFEGRNIVSNYTGIEIWNVDWGQNDQRARDWWISNLLGNKKTYIYGGIGTHLGNFFGSVYNVAYLSNFNQASLKDSLKNGYSSVSNNGNLYIELKNDRNGTWHHMGETVKVCKDDRVTINANYNIINIAGCTLKIFEGGIGSGIESTQTFPINGAGSDSVAVGNIITRNSYYRAECISSDGTKRIYTNPIWVEINTTDADNDGACAVIDCQDNDNTIIPGGSEGICNDGKDNDCDGLVDGADTADCAGYGCSCSAWRNVGCGAGSCRDNQMRQVRSCSGNNCQESESRCVGDPLCSTPSEPCSISSIEKSCNILSDEQGGLDFTDRDADSKGSSDPIFIKGSNFGDELAAAFRFDVNDPAYSTCQDSLVGNENWISESNIQWNNDDPDDSCSSTDLSVYTRNDDDMDSVNFYEQFLTDKGNWNKVNDLPSSCSPEGRTNTLDITSSLKADLSISDNDEITYGFLPESTQARWVMNRAGKNVKLNAEYCKPCTDNDGDGYGVECSLGTDCNDNDQNVFPGRGEICADGIDNDCDSSTDCTDSECSGQSCGTCKFCSGGTCSGTPADDNACGTIDCSWYYNKTGTQGPATTETCYNKKDVTSNRCASFGQCKSPNTVAICGSQPNDQPQYSCGTCSYIAIGSCTSTTLGSCSLYNTSIECDSNLKCSSSAQGNNAFDQFNFKSPSKAYCDGAGQCDYVPLSAPTCSLVEGTAQEGKDLTICVDGNSACVDSCSDNVDNDNDGLKDAQDTDCVPALIKYYIQNSTGGNVASFDNLGNLTLKGTCSVQTNCLPDADSFIIANSTDTTVAYINSTGSLCIERGDCSDLSVSCNPSRDAFIIEDKNGKNVSYIDFNGDLCLTGKILQNIVVT